MAKGSISDQLGSLLKQNGDQGFQHNHHGKRQQGQGRRLPSPVNWIKDGEDHINISPAGTTDLGTGITTWPGGFSNNWNDLDGYNEQGGWGSSSPEYDPYYNPGTYTGDMGNMDGGDAWAGDDSYSSGGDDYYYDY